MTGADGFIGSHLVEKLVRSDYKVKAFVCYNSFNTWGWLDHCSSDVKDHFEVFSGDIRDPTGVFEATSGCDAVVHLAALIGIPYSYHSPSTYIDTNVNGTLNVVAAAKKLEIQKLVHTSTSEVYGTALNVPIDENHPLKGQSPYSASKIAADQIAMSYYYSFGTPVAIIRPFNTYGPRQSARAVIPSIIIQIIAGSRKIKLGSLHPTRDFSYVKDVVTGFIAAMETEASVGEVINLGSNFEISISDTVQTIIEIMGAEVDVVSDDDRIRPLNSEVDRLWADNAKAAEVLKWEPEYAGLVGFRRGISETLDWFSDKENIEGYKSNQYNI